MPEQVAMPLQIIFAEIQLDHLVATIPEPCNVVRHFALTRGISHSAWNDELPRFTLADKDLIVGEDHILEISNRIQNFNRETSTYECGLDRFPLFASKHKVQRLTRLHKWI